MLVDVDVDYVKGQGKSVCSPVIFTGGQKIELLKTGAVEAGEGKYYQNKNNLCKNALCLVLSYFF